MNEALSWSEANAACLAKGLQLASVHSAAENALLVTAAAGNIPVWIGGTDAASEDTWKWSPSGTPLPYTNWAQGEPNNSQDNEHCLEVYPLGWNDAPCTVKHKFVCQTPPPVYRLMNEVLSWSEANAACLQKGLQLASVHSEVENARLVTAAAGNNVWIGGTDAASEGTWKWRPSDTPLSYTNWHPGPPEEPNSAGNEDCMEVYAFNGKWNDLRCSDKKKYICQITTPAAYPVDLNAWYCPGAFDLASGTWQDCSGNGNTAALSGSGLAELRRTGHGATNEVLALSGTTSSVIAFGAVIKSSFTVCSVTRYTGGATGRILDGSGANWLHGHWRGNAGVAHYGRWTTAQQGNVSPNTDWVVMCGTNDGSQLKLANGVDVGTANDGLGRVALFVNGGSQAQWETSNFAIAEVVVWPRGLTAEEMRGASEHLINRLG